MPSHSHSFTPSGAVKVTTNPTFTGSAVNTGAMSTNSTGSISSSNYGLFSHSSSDNVITTSGCISVSDWSGKRRDGGKSDNNPKTLSINVAHTHSVTAKGTINGGAYSFTGTTGTTTNTGSNIAFSILPPYVVKYCWERIA